MEDARGTGYASAARAHHLSSVSRAFDRAIADERLRSVRRGNRYRCYALSIFLALVLAFRLSWRGWIGPLDKLIVYWAASIVIWLVGTLSERVARRTSLAVPMLDLPMVLWLMIDNTTMLEAAGLHLQSQAVRLGAGIFFLVIVVLTSLSLDVHQVYLAGVVAAACAIYLMWLGEPDFTWILLLPATIAVAVMALAYAIDRTHVLVRTVATEEIRRARLGRYFPPQVAEQVELDDDAMRAGESREITLLFCDIRGFTALADRLEGREIVATLNDFHSRMVEAIFEQAGTLDKFMGDGIMAYFGAPIAQPDHALRAVRCALRMEEKLAALNTARATCGSDPLRMGIGIHTGTVLLADIGAPGRRDYTAIGDAVNVAARLEQATKDQPATILISEATYRQVGGAVPLRPVAPAVMRGKLLPMACWTPVVGS